MAKHRSSFFALIPPAVIFTVLLISNYVGQQSPVIQTPPGSGSRESRIPIADYDSPEPKDPAELAKRKLRGRRYDKSDWAVNPNAPSDTTVRVDFIDPNLPAFPISQSPVVVLGRVLDSRAYLSNDKTGVYSVFSIQIEQVLKSSLPITNGSVIETERDGGRVKFPSGRLHLYLTDKADMPIVGGRYVLFLDAKNDQAFQIVTAYEIQDRKVRPLDRFRNAQRYNDWDESEFLTELTNKLRS
jgi:hypothetical protein